MWLLNKIFLPGSLNSFAGLISTLINVYSQQGGTWVSALPGIGKECADNLAEYYGEGHGYCDWCLYGDYWCPVWHL